MILNQLFDLLWLMLIKNNKFKFEVVPLLLNAIPKIDITVLLGSVSNRNGFKLL